MGVDVSLEEVQSAIAAEVEAPPVLTLSIPRRVPVPSRLPVPPIARIASGGFPLLDIG